MGCDAGARPVDGLINVGKWRALIEDARHELVNEMWMRPAVTAALDEG
jgi:hypothetical protein